MRGLFAFAILVAVAACGEVSSTIDAATTCVPACGANATCQGTTCTCDPGYTGDGQTCTDVDECADANGGCHANATCTNADGSRTCACQAGYSGDGLTCTDIDECATNNGGCDANATCSNFGGGRACTCQAGYLGDGVTCRPIWVQVGSLPGARLDPENFGAHAVAAGSRLYFGPRANDPAVRYMRSFDVATNTFSAPLAFPPGSQPDFCACGYTASFLSNGTNLWLLGNEGLRYNVATNAWVDVPSYDANARGEAAWAFDPVDSSFLLIGGRSAGSTAIRMSVPGEVFAAEPGSIPASMSSAVAYNPPGARISYVAGGDFNGGQALVSHTNGTATWTRLADAPDYLGRAAGMGEFDGLLWVARTDGNFFFYNRTANTWRPAPIAAPAGFVTAEMVAGQTYVLAEVGGAINVYRLNAIQ